MKIIDETGAAVETPDLTAGYLVADTEEILHPAQEAVEEEWHWETVAEYPNGGKDVRKVIDREGTDAQEEWVEQVPVQRYIRYTDEELAEQEAEKKKAEQAARLPTTEERLAALEAAMLDLLAGEEE